MIHRGQIYIMFYHLLSKQKATTKKKEKRLSDETCEIINLKQIGTLQNALLMTYSQVNHLKKSPNPNIFRMI